VIIPSNIAMPLASLVVAVHISDLGSWASATFEHERVSFIDEPSFQRSRHGTMSCLLR
jgi:hypothetical protein